MLLEEKAMIGSFENVSSKFKERAVTFESETKTSVKTLKLQNLSTDGFFPIYTKKQHSSIWQEVRNTVITSFMGSIRSEEGAVTCQNLS